MLYLFNKERFLIHFVKTILKPWGILDSRELPLGNILPPQKVLGGQWLICVRTVGMQLHEAA